MKIKWRNYGLWVALGALVVMAVTDLTNVSSDSVQAYVDIALTILVAAGVVSNPAQGRWFIDKGDENEGGNE